MHGVNRCVIAEELLLHPLCIAIVTEVLAIAPVQPQANDTIKLRKRLIKKEDAKLDYVLLKLIKRDLVTTEQLQRVADVPAVRSSAQSSTTSSSCTRTRRQTDCCSASDPL